MTGNFTYSYVFQKNIAYGVSRANFLTYLTALVQSAKCRVQSAECRVQSAECRVQSAECRVINHHPYDNLEVGFFMNFCWTLKNCRFVMFFKEHDCLGIW